MIEANNAVATNGRGTLILLVGGSGADTAALLAAAAAARPDIHVARQVATRSRGAAEADRGLSEAAFSALRRSGRLALDWRAQGRRFGLRSRIEPRLAAGQHVLADAGRAAIAAARARYSPCRVVLVSAPEPAADERPLPGDLDAVTLERAGALDAAVARFIAALPPERAAAG